MSAKENNNIRSNASSSSLDMYRSMLEKKADSQVVEAQLKTVEAKLRAIENNERETREIALSARKAAKEPHECFQEEAIKKFTSFMENTKTIKVASVLGLAILIAGVVYQSRSQSDRNDTTDVVISEIKDSMKRVESEVGFLKKEHKKKKQESETDEIEQMKLFVKLATKAFIAASETKNRKRR